MKHCLTKKRIAALCAMMLCAVMILPLGAVFATAPTPPLPTIISDLEATKVLKSGESATLSVAAQIIGAGYTTEFKWFRNGNELKDENDKSINKNSITVGSDALGRYRVAVYGVNAKGETESSVFSTECNVTLAEAPVAKGSLYVTAYTVQDANGNELQRVGVGEKCQIVVGVRDGRFTSVPTKTDAYGNIANFKITTTTSFATPTFGDIRMTSPKMVNGELEYAIIFNDITYIGGENKLGIDVSYNDQSIAMQNLSVGISQCFNPAAVNTTKPAVMVKEFSFGGSNVNAGASFTLNLTSYNTSNVVGISDVTTSVTLPANITIAGGSNVALHPVVTPGGTFADTFALQVQNSAETGVANVTVNYSFYVQGSENPITSTQIIAVPIVQPDRFSFTSLDMPNEMYAGEENTITINYVNKGKGVLYNVSAEIAGEISNPGQGQYMGNLNSGTEGSVDFSVKTEGIGPVSGVITISYEDVNGTVKQHKQEFTGEMLPLPTGGDLPMAPDMGDLPTESAGIPWWGWTLIVVGGAAVLCIMIVIIKKAKAKKRAAELSDAEDDEE